MTDHDGQNAERIRIARHGAVCAARTCLALIWPGCRITKIDGSGWKHADCSRPGQGTHRERRSEP